MVKVGEQKVIKDKAPGPIDKREAILDATLSLLASRGFHGFSMKQLSDLAGVAAGTIYLYFHDKQDLIAQLHDSILKKVAEHIFAGYTPEQPFRDQHRVICRNMWQFFTDNPDILFSKSQFDHLPPETLQCNKEGARSYMRPIVDLFEKGKAQGVLRDLPDEVLFGLGMEPHMALARQCNLGLLTLNEVCLEQIIDATWEAMAVGSEN